MPLCKPQELKALSSISMQPEKMSNRIEAIMCMDLAGKGTGDIARELGMTASRISVIKGSPMYQSAIVLERDRLKEVYREKQTDRLISGDPVEQVLKDSALEAARCKVELMNNGKSEFVRLAASGDILDRAGYKAHQDKTKVTVEITEKMASRFENALAMGRTAALVGGEAEPTSETTSRIRIERVEG
jgi:hypothetical protein